MAMSLHGDDASFVSCQATVPLYDRAMTRTDDDQLREVADLTSVVTYRLARANNKLTAQVAHLLKESSDLSLAEWRILRLLAAQNETTMADLARATEIDKGQLSRKIKALREAGHVTVTPDAVDHRKLDLSITDAGRAAVNALLPMAAKRQAALRRKISDAELAIFLDVLQRLEEAAEIREL